MLKVTGMYKSFGAIQALNQVDVTVNKGAIHGIIGPNGSGKTTFFNCVTGLLKADAGKIELDSMDITGKDPTAISRLGIKRTFQAGKLVPTLTVLENVMAGINDQVGAASVDTFLRLPFIPSKRETQIELRAREILKLVGMADSANRWANDLVWTERQLVQIARALVSDPKLLLLDEPASGMGMKEMEKVEEIINDIRKEGITVVVVSHDVRMLMNLSDMVTVFNFGKKIAEGTPEEIRHDRLVQEAYLGAE